MSMELPVLLITNGVLLPEAKLKVSIKSETNLAMLDRFVINKTGPGKSLILVAYQMEEEKKIFPTATIALVEQVVCWRHNSHVQYTVHLVGVSRAKIEQFALPVSTAKQMYSIEGEVTPETAEEFIGLAKILNNTISVNSLETSHRLKKLIAEKNFDHMTDLCVANIHTEYGKILEYLATVDVGKRVKIAIEWLKAYTKESNEGMFKRDTVSLETLFGPGRPRRIQNVPGRHGPSKNSIEDLEERLHHCGLPETEKDKIWSDFDRLKQMTSGGAHNQEAHVLQGYLELVASLPWNKSTQDVINIPRARNLLEASHEGMTDVKKRLLEYLAVKKLNDSLSGPILCFAGPPGIGKTSVAKAIADSLGRKFERISLGGIRDESDIRGHRRTYVASMPGRIIQAIKHAGTNNPVILLDEVDKLYAGINGSPSAALLEVLDPEQNSTFVDHYLNLAFDLSKVIFVATANDLGQIAGPLSDRLEIIEMSGYSTSEKCRIAENHIIPRQLARHGICPDHLHIEPQAIIKIVEIYTRESGVRQMERCVGTICRFTALKLAEALNADFQADCVVDLQLPIVVDPTLCTKILGREKFNRIDMVEKMRSFDLGTCFGMAWTPFGGEVLIIEATQCDGKGKVMMTGKLGEVLRESVNVARSWIRSNANRYNASTLNDCDLHVHLPSGGVEKDGPSAGCAIVAALFSLASRHKVRNDTAVTGEISLTGHVLPVGGIKEKVLGAHRAGLRRVILPEANRKDADRIDESVQADTEIVFVSDIDELLRNLMEKTRRADVLSKL